MSYVQGVVAFFGVCVGATDLKRMQCIGVTSQLCWAAATVLIIVASGLLMSPFLAVRLSARMTQYDHRCKNEEKKASPAPSTRLTHAQPRPLITHTHAHTHHKTPALNDLSSYSEAIV